MVHETKQRGDRYALLMTVGDVTMRKYFSSYRTLESYTFLAMFTYKRITLRALKQKGRRWVELYRF